jgi:Pyridoxamine 5'-phosphate oxidase
MSVPVTLEELPEQIERFGPHAYVVTVGEDGRPRATSVSVSWHNAALLKFGAGRRTAENVSGNDQIALLWPAPVPGEHALLVDGWGAVHNSPETGDTVVFIQPGKAVLHVTTPARV